MPDSRLGLKTVIFGFQLSFVGYAMNSLTVLLAGGLVSVLGLLHPIRS